MIFSAQLHTRWALAHFRTVPHMGQARARLLSCDPPGIETLHQTLRTFAAEARYPVDVLDTVYVFLDPRSADDDPVEMVSMRDLCAYLSARFTVRWDLEPNSLTWYVVVDGDPAELSRAARTVAAHVSNAVVAQPWRPTSWEFRLSYS